MSKRRDRRYWKTLEEREAPAGALPSVPEFPDPSPGGTLDRRRFLALSGFGLLLAGCGRGTSRKALPHLRQHADSAPGRPLDYASTCLACPAACGLLARTRDGRPVKLEGNPSHALSRGGLCAVGQASLLGLYDGRRFRTPLRAGARAAWSEIDADLAARLRDLRTKGGALRVLTRSLPSPTLRAALAAFLAPFPDARLVTYDPLSRSAIADAHARTHGVRAIPHYRFDRAEAILSVDADFLGTWISPVEFSKAWSDARSPESKPARFSWHAQVESRLSLAGAKADLRVAAAPWELGLVLSQVASRVASKAGQAWPAAPLEAPAVPSATLDHVAERLWAARGRALVVSGLQDPEAQAVVNLLNHHLGAYGTTIDLDRPSLQAQGNDADLETLARELADGKISALLVLEGNPVYELPLDWPALLAKVPLVVACSERPDETSALAGMVCPRPHALASWGDAEPVSGRYSLVQPVFPVLGEARPILESIAAWSGTPGNALDLVRAHWKSAIHPMAAPGTPFDSFWDRALHDGWVDLPSSPSAPRTFASAAVAPVGRAQAPASGAFALVLYPKAGLLDGSHAYNPWLQELPDPVTKAAWDNYVCIAPAAAAAAGLRDGDLVTLRSDGLSMELPVLVQPGQHERTLAVALGYGSRLSERFQGAGPRWIEGRPTTGPDGRVGRNAAPWLRLAGGALVPGRDSVRLERAAGRRPLALSQIQHSLSVPAGLAPHGAERRPMVRESSVQALPAPKTPAPPKPDLWPDDHSRPGPRWGMVIDLGACTGCSSCVIACQAENNIPVVGRDEVLRQRDLQWIRIDRYYADAPGGVDVAFQPMMCHHCANAPCETVCPALATVRSEDGLNQQVYNRCVGTRYCANNCPYKVRRFNWFDYPRGDEVENLALNPGVTVRSRGVMEKCSLCVQRIQEARLDAKRRGVPVADGDVQTACQQTCPASAITFGDLNDPSSAVSRKAASGRSYQVLAELNVKPGVHYLDLVRNRPPEETTRHE